MSLLEDNIELFSSYSGDVQNVFIRLLIKDFKSQNLAYMQNLIDTSFTDKLLSEMGMAAAIDGMIADYNEIARQSIAAGVSFQKIPEEFIDVLKKMDTQFWYEHVRDVGLEAKRNMLLASIGGVPESELADRLLKATKELSQAQVNTLTNTQLRTYSRSVFTESVRDLPTETEFIYTGGALSANSRDFCIENFGKIFLKEDAFALTNDQGGQAMTDAGGFNCVHSLDVIVE